MSPERGKAESSSFSAFLMPALAAIGTGIGVLGFVMFFGGFILWARFKGAGLPANEAVARVPRSDLVTTGASFIVPGVLAALGLVAFALALWDIFLGGPRRKRRERADIRGEEAAERLADLQ
jgi:F0F1-type ATP synthase membrane subunit c/vacuolar-type H+-ATPase subunit K